MFERFSDKVFSFVSGNAGSNVFLVVGDKEVALVDSSIAVNSGEILGGLSSLGYGPGDVSLVLHTHGHADHFGCDGLFENAGIGMHELDAKRINVKDREFACASFFPDTKMPVVSLFLKDGQKIDLGGIQLSVVHTSGHTGGSVCFFDEKEGLLFSGDTLFAGGFGRTDFPSGSGAIMLESLKSLQKRRFGALFPGHGSVLLGEKENSVNLAGVIKTASTNAFL